MDTTKLIEAYLEGTLDKPTAAEIAERELNDPRFAAIIRLHKEVNTSIRDNELALLRKQLNDIVGKKNRISPKMLPVRYLFLYAAAILLLFLLGFEITKWIKREHDPHWLYTRYYQKYEPDIIVRGIPNDIGALKESILLYQSGKYKACADSLSYLLHRENSNYLAWFYMGLTRLEQKDAAKAIGCFRSIPPDWGSPYSIHRNWYLALAMLRENQSSGAIPILRLLANENSYYCKEAKEILKKLRK
jgi:hypothetical protein